MSGIFADTAEAKDRRDSWAAADVSINSCGNSFRGGLEADLNNNWSITTIEHGFKPGCDEAVIIFRSAVQKASRYGSIPQPFAFKTTTENFRCYGENDADRRCRAKLNKDGKKFLDDLGIFVPLSYEPNHPEIKPGNLAAIIDPYRSFDIRYGHPKQIYRIVKVENQLITLEMYSDYVTNSGIACSGYSGSSVVLLDKNKVPIKNFRGQFISMGQQESVIPTYKHKTAPDFVCGTTTYVSRTK